MGHSWPVTNQNSPTHIARFVSREGSGSAHGLAIVQINQIIDLHKVRLLNRVLVAVFFAQFRRSIWRFTYLAVAWFPLIVRLVHLLKPFGSSAVVVDFRHGEVREDPVWRSAMPVARIGWNHRSVAWANFSDGFAFELNTSNAGYNPEGLPDRMLVPGCPRAGAECHVGRAHS